MPEPLIWGYVIQLSGVLRQIHAAGLACRVLDPTKILVTGAVTGALLERGEKGHLGCLEVRVDSWKVILT